MKERTRGSEWVSIRRSLAIFRRLLRGPADQEELVGFVREWVGQDAYPQGKEARRSAFKRDIRNLRDQLFVACPFDRTKKAYVLEDPGPFGYLNLSPDSLLGLRSIAITFAGDLGERAWVQQLLNELLGRLSPEERRRLERGSSPVDVDVFQGIDSGTIADRVWETVQHAVRVKREMTFHYRSPQYADQQPRYHRVAPLKIQYKRGHWYLFAYDLRRRNPQGEEQYEEGYKSFRLHYIQDDEQLTLLPGRIPSNLRRPPRYPVHYRLLPPLGRGEISRHFDEMKIVQHPDGSAEVMGVCEDDFDAARILLSYGDRCVVLGGPKVLRRVEEAVRGMARHYQILDQGGEP